MEQGRYGLTPRFYSLGIYLPKNGNLVIFPSCNRILGLVLRPPACTSPSNQNLLLTLQR